MLLGFIIGLFVGMIGTVIMMSLMTMSKISDLQEEIRVLNEMERKNKKNQE